MGLGFASWIGSAIAVWQDTEVEKGHWIEVRPRVDPAENLAVSEKLYVLAIPTDDEVLTAWATRGWLRVYGGGRWSSVVDVPSSAGRNDATTAVREAWTQEAEWIADWCEPNTLGNPITLIVDENEIPRRRTQRRECQRHMTRLQLGALLEAEAVEPVDPSRARQWRRSALWLGWMAALVGDESTLDFQTLAAHERMRGDMRGLARASAGAMPLEPALEQLLTNYLGPRRDEYLGQ